MSSFHRALTWLFLMNKRVLKKPLFLLLLALVPVLSAVSVYIPQSGISLLRVGLVAGDPEDETTQAIFKELRHSKSSVIKYYICSSEEELREDIAQGQTRLGYLFPEDPNLLFAAYGSQDDVNISNALAILANIAEGASTEVRKYSIRCLVGSNDIVSKLARDQLYGQIYSYLERAVLNAWLDAHPEGISMTDEERDAFIDTALSEYSIDDNFFEMAYMDGDVIQEGDIYDYFSAPIRGLLAALVVLSALAGALSLIQDVEHGRMVWLSERSGPFFRYLCMLIPVFDIGLASFIAISLSSGFVNPVREFGLFLLFILCCTGMGNLLRVILRSSSLIGAMVPILVIGCLFLTPVFIDMVVFEPAQILLPPYLYLKSLHGAWPAWALGVYAAVTFSASIGIDLLKPQR